MSDQTEISPAPNLITTLQESLLRLDSETATDADVLTALGFATRLKELAAELKDKVDTAACKHIKAHGEITCGEIRYYVGTPTTTKCRDVKAALEGLLKASGGDFGAVANCLGSGAWKHGEARKVLGDKFFEHFVSGTSDELKEGKPAKEPKEPKLQKSNMAFEKGRKRK